MKCHAKIVNGSWIQATIFTKSSILDVSLGSEYASDYLEAFSIIMYWGFHFEFFKNFSNLIIFYHSLLKKAWSRSRLLCSIILKRMLSDVLIVAMWPKCVQKHLQEVTINVFSFQEKNVPRKNFIKISWSY